MYPSPLIRYREEVVLTVKPVALEAIATTDVSA